MNLFATPTKAVIVLHWNLENQFVHLMHPMIPCGGHSGTLRQKGDLRTAENRKHRGSLVPYHYHFYIFFRKNERGFVFIKW